MIRLSVKIDTRGTPPLHRLKYFETWTVPFMQEQLIALANVVKDTMRSLIEQRKRKRFVDKSTLEKAINVDIIFQTSNVLVVGVGKISELPLYWRALNDGFTPPTINKFIAGGSFSDGAPDPSKSGGIWYAGQGWKLYTFFDKKIHKSVAPFNYIDLAEAEGYKVLIDIQKRISNLIKTGSV
jgi:hypothetical protein